MVSDAEAADGHAKLSIMLLLLVLIFVLDLQWAFLHIHFLSCICFVLWGHHSLPFRFCCCKSDITAPTCMQLHENANDTSHKYIKYMSLKPWVTTELFWVVFNYHITTYKIFLMSFMLIQRPPGTSLVKWGNMGDSEATTRVSINRSPGKI